MGLPELQAVRSRPSREAPVLRGGSDEEDRNFDDEAEDTEGAARRQFNSNFSQRFMELPVRKTVHQLITPRAIHSGARDQTNLPGYWEKGSKKN